MTGTVSHVGDRMLYVWATKDVIRGYDGKPDEGLVDILAVTRNAAELDLDAFGLTSGCGTTCNERRDGVSAYIVDGELWESPAPPLEVVQPMKMERLTAGGFTGTGAPSPFYPGEEKWLIAEGTVYRCNVCRTEFTGTIVTYRDGQIGSYTHSTVTHKIEKCEG